MPEERDLNDYILVFPADSGIKPIYVYLKDDPRNQAGTATGNGTQIENGKMWLDLSVTNNGEGAKIPAHIADKFRGRKYKDFREFREDLWLEVSKYPELSKQFSRGNLDAMREGNAPTGLSDGYYQGPTRLIKKYEIHHIKPIEDGDGVYDIDNLRIVTPKLHKFIHYGK